MAPRGPADDGKRFSSDGRCIYLASRREDLREGVQGEGGARGSSPGGRLAGDGKRFSSDGRYVLIASRREDSREGVQGEGGARDVGKRFSSDGRCVPDCFSERRL